MPHKSNGKTRAPKAPASRIEFGQPDASREAEEPGATAEAKQAAGRVVRVGCIGRGNAGKTALFRTLAEGPVGDFLPSGLHIDVGDPKEVARLIRESEEMQRALRQSGLPPTTEATPIRYYLYDGDKRCAAIQLREVIGQILTNTLPDSSAEWQARYDEYIHSLVNANVLWVVVPCPPPNPAPGDRRRYAHDLRIATAYLREALRLRSQGPPAAVSLTLSKIDTLFPDEAAARAALDGERILDSLGPLVDLVERSRHVGDVAVIPVSAFGFGNAAPRERAPFEGDADDPFGTEPAWLLKEGASADPYNLDSLMMWTLFVGLFAQLGECTEAGRPGASARCQMLYDDLTSKDRWLLPIKGRLAGE